MQPKPQLIDLIRTVPEIAVRLWAGGKPFVHDDGVRITFEDREITVSSEVYQHGDTVARILAVRWGNRLLRTINDVLELRHAAEDVFLSEIFGKGSIPRVLFVPAGTAASAYYRAMFPSDLMGEGKKVISNWTVKVDIAKVLRYDVLWIQLITAPILNEIAREAKRNGLKIVYDIDDRLDAIPEENQSVSIYGNAEKQAEIHEMMRIADLVTVSTEPLAQYVRSLGIQNVRVVRNQLTANVIPRRHTPDPRFTRILWAGSPTHKRDLAIIAPALRNVLKRHRGKVRFTCFGEQLPEVLADCQEWIDLREPVDFDSYHDALALIAADFAIAPLEGNAFNASKSAIKALEYATAGYPMLLSPVGEYPFVVSEGLPAKLVPDHEWENQLEQMIAMPRDEREQIGKKCITWVCENRCIGATKASQWSDVVLELFSKSKKPNLKLV